METGPELLLKVFVGLLLPSDGSPVGLRVWLFEVTVIVATVLCSLLPCLAQWTVATLVWFCSLA